MNKFIQLFLLIFTFGCFKARVKGDTKPDVKEISQYTGNNLIISHLEKIETIQFAENGNICAFSYDTTDRGLKSNHKLIEYDKDFNTIKSTIIKEDRQGLWFVDQEANFYAKGFNGVVLKYKYPNYNPDTIPLHPLTIPYQNALKNELLSHKNGTNSDLYHKLKKENKDYEIKKRNNQVVKETKALIEKHLNIDEISYGYFLSNGYFLFMEDGSISFLPGLQTSYGKSRVSDVFKKHKKTTRIYHHYGTKDWSKSLANINHVPNHNVKKTGFSVTESKTTLQNWPNQGYTKGYYYYDINFKNHKTSFKIKDRKNKKPMHEVSKKGYDFFFIKALYKWYIVKQK